MVQFIGKYCVVRCEYDFENTSVGIETRSIQNGVLATMEFRQFLFELLQLPYHINEVLSTQSLDVSWYLMNILRATNKSNRTQARSVSIQNVFAVFNHIWMALRKLNESFCVRNSQLLELTVILTDNPK